MYCPYSGEIVDLVNSAPEPNPSYIDTAARLGMAGPLESIPQASR